MIYNVTIKRNGDKIVMICENADRCKVDCWHKIKHLNAADCTTKPCSNEDGIFGSRCVEYKEEPVTKKLEKLADQKAKADAGKLRYDLIEGSMIPDIIGNYPFQYLKPGALTLNTINKAIWECMFIIGSHTLFLEELAKVYTFGCQKYSEKSWQTVPNGRARYEAALFRHIEKYKKREWVNHEDGGCLHIAQVAFNAIAVKWFMLQEK